jgi:hypothetical protein
MGRFAFLIFMSLTIGPALLANASTVAESRTAGNGHTFTQNFDYPVLGSAWKDDSSLIWGELVVDKQGNDLDLTQAEAAAYCDRIGARLPTQMEFFYLDIYLGDDGHGSFDPLLLPNIEGHMLWSSTFNSISPTSAYVFHGSTGLIDYMNVENRISFRCVAR